MRYAFIVVGLVISRVEADPQRLILIDGEARLCECLRAATTGRDR